MACASSRVSTDEGLRRRAPRQLLERRRSAPPVEPVRRPRRAGRRPAGTRRRSNPTASTLLLLAARNTYGSETSIPEKIIPLFITNALEGESLPVYGDGRQTRDWLHVEDHCAGVELVLHEGEPGGGLQRRWRRGRVEKPGTSPPASSRLTGADDSLIRHCRGPTRPRPAATSLDTSKLRTLGWEPQHTLADGLPKTVAWYRDKPRVVGSRSSRGSISRTTAGSTRARPVLILAAVLGRLECVLGARGRCGSSLLRGLQVWHGFRCIVQAEAGCSRGL